MAKTTRSVNLDLIRWLNYGHKNTSKKLASITNENYISKMATGEMEISDYRARKIERTLELPAGWMDRDNVLLLKMGEMDFNLHQALKSYPADARAALATFLSSKR